MFEHLGVSGGKATIIGSSKKTSPRFAAFVNGVSIHADDFDDTQLSGSKDRVYGLLVHPTVAGAARAAGPGRKQDDLWQKLMLAYHLAWRWNAKSQKLSRHDITRTDFTPQGHAGRSARQQLARNYFNSTLSKIRIPLAWRPASRGACAKISAR